MQKFIAAEIDPFVDEWEKADIFPAHELFKWFLGRLRAVEAAMAKADTLCADRFTAADSVIGYALRLAENIGLASETLAGEQRKVAPRR